MLSNHELITAITDSLGECALGTTWFQREGAALKIIAALRASGAILAEGTVCVDAKQWEDTSDMADALCQWVDGIRYYKREAAAEHLATGGMPSWDDLSYIVDEFRTAYVGDLDAVPARAGDGAE